MRDPSDSKRWKSAAAEREIATLVAREERMRLALAAGRIHTWDWDVSADVLVWSEGLEKELSLACAPADMQSLRKLVHPDDIEFVSRRIEAALQGPNDYEAEFRMIRGDGSVRWCSARAIVVRDDSGKAVRMVGVDMDVTERHHLVARSLDSEARLRFAMETAGAGTWEYAVDRDEFFASDRALELHGLPRGKPITNRAALDAVFPEDRPKVEEAVKETIATGVAFRQELRVLQPDGSIRWLQSQAELRWEDGQRRLIGLVQDITERKEVEIELRRNKERFAIALGNSPTAVFEQDLDLRYTWIYNPKLGYSAAEVIGKTDAEIMDAECAPPVEALKRLVIATGAPVRQEVAAAAPSGPREYFDLYVEPRRDASGGIVGIICTATDITAGKKVEAALRDGEALYRSAMALGRMASWETNYVTGVRRWTPEGAALFGLNLVDGIGTIGGAKDEYLLALHPDDRHVYQAYLDLENQQDSYAAEYRIVLPDGQTRWMSGYGRVLDRDTDGRPLRMVNVATDVTERTKIEEHTRFLLHELSHRSKNTLAVVQAIVTLSSRNAGSAKDFAKTINGRLSALAASNDLLTAGSWNGAPLDQLVHHQVGAFVGMPNPRVCISGPELALTAESMQSIGLALHELTTNAVKYGALSGPDGEVCIDWAIEPDPGGPTLRLNWMERGGPHVAQPKRNGFGQVVLKQMIEQAISATTTIEYAPTGVRWSMRAPASRVLNIMTDRA